jgi:hypothetical protein
MELAILVHLIDKIKMDWGNEVLESCGPHPLSLSTGGEGNAAHSPRFSEILIDLGVFESAE